MVLAIPELAEADLVGPYGEIDVALKAKRRIFIQRMERREEDTQAKRNGTQLNLVS
jgi:hypothetical protein